jgi:hypothetical protein
MAELLEMFSSCRPTLAACLDLAPPHLSGYRIRHQSDSPVDLLMNMIVSLILEGTTRSPPPRSPSRPTISVTLFESI